MQRLRKPAISQPKKTCVLELQTISRAASLAALSFYDNSCNFSSPPPFPFVFSMATSSAFSQENCRPGGV
jgi:hypothetical protein